MEKRMFNPDYTPLIAQPTHLGKVGNTPADEYCAAATGYKMEGEEYMDDDGCEQVTWTKVPCFVGTYFSLGRPIILKNQSEEQQTVTVRTLDGAVLDLVLDPGWNPEVVLGVYCKCDDGNYDTPLKKAVGIGADINATAIDKTHTNLIYGY